MKDIRLEFLKEENHKDSNCFVIVIIAHGTEKRNVQTVDGRTAYNIDTLEEQVGRIATLDGQPKLIFVEACRGKKQNFVANEVETKEACMEEEDEDTITLIASDERDEGRDLHLNEKKAKGGSLAMPNNAGGGGGGGMSLATDHTKRPAKRDQFIGLSTVEDYVAYTVNTSGSPYILNLCKQLLEGGFTKTLQEIHHKTRQEVGSHAFHGEKYIVADEHNRLVT